MGTRLEFHLICGITKFDGELKDDLLDAEVPRLPFRTGASTMGQIRAEINDYLLVHPDYGDAIFSNHSVPGVVGTHIADVSPNYELFLVLAALDQRYRNPGWTQIPRYRDLRPLTKTDYRRQLERYDKDIEMGVAIDIPGLNRPKEEGRRMRGGDDYQWWSWEWPTEVAKALYILNGAGICVRRQQLKLMLVWTWS